MIHISANAKVTMLSYTANSLLLLGIYIDMSLNSSYIMHQAEG
jgi:hypothetical protein